MSKQSGRHLVDALLDIGMRVQQEKYEPEGSVIELGYGNLRFRLIKHHGEEWLEMQPRGSTKEWFDIGVVRAHLESGFDLLLTEQINDSVSFVGKEIHRISACFGAGNSESAMSSLRALRHERAVRMFGKQYG